MGYFLDELRKHSATDAREHWFYLPYDQLTASVGPLSRVPASAAGIVLIENRWKARRRPYHRQKLGFVLASMRAFALEQAKLGVRIHYGFGDAPYAELLRPIAKRHGTLTVMVPAEREMREDLEPLARDGSIELTAHEGFLTSRQDFLDAMDGKRSWRMDVFYRHVRKTTGILMDRRGKPEGGKWSYDVDNRLPWRGEPPVPKPLRFERDPLRAEVEQLVRSSFRDHPGTLDLTRTPIHQGEIDRWFSSWLQTCLDAFGPYEDAMAEHEPRLFHARISHLINVHRLLPQDVIAAVDKADAPLASREGFIRQVLGWREFVTHVHRETDGFRTYPAFATEAPRVEQAPPGDGGYRAWLATQAPSAAQPTEGDAPAIVGDESRAAPRFEKQTVRLPLAYWGVPSGLRCLDRVVSDVWSHGYSHHITRLMVLSNIATLLGVEPRDLTDWFWVAYDDAFDWVVEPNVLAMGTFAVGEIMTTKPYVSGAGYIHKMGDACAKCAFDPKSTCPLTRLYWAFLARHEKALAHNPRLAMPLRSLNKRTPTQRDRDRRTLDWVRDALERGDVLRPEHDPTA